MRFIYSCKLLILSLYSFVSCVHCVILLKFLSVVLEQLLLKPGVQKHGPSLDQKLYAHDQNVYVRDQRVYVHLMRKFRNDMKTKVSRYFRLIAKKKAVAG